jgi:CheY-like chemotaxis protein
VSSNFQISIKAGDRTYEGGFTPGSTLREILQVTDCRPFSACSGNGFCGMCRVRVEGGGVSPPTDPEKLGYEYQVAENGRVALDLLERYSFDLVLMDLQMPVLDGLSATREIRALPDDNPVKNIPVIAVTASAYSKDRTQSLEAGCNEHLVKPVSRLTLQKELEKWIPRGIQQPPRPQPAEGPPRQPKTQRMY